MDTFCLIANKKLPSKILFEDEDFMAILDIGPKTDGHTLIIPKSHAQNLSDISSKISAAMFAYAAVREKELYAMGYNSVCMRINMGKAQEIPHLHIHIWGESL